ncbi:MAG TPA: hypothetical protein VFL67_10155 [Mycobacterium sp.]|nr:hypothetical protein [Mycobacterium sp.]
MQLALRPYVTTGIAMVGAAAIAVTPISVTPHDIRVPAVYSSDVQLAALLNPFEVFAPIVGQAVANAQVIGQKVFDNPMPILRALALNQLDSAGTLAGLGVDVATALATMVLSVPGNLQTAIGLLQQGKVDQALKVVENGFVSPFIPLFMSGLPKLIDVLKRPLIDAQVLLDTLPSSLIVGVGFPLLNTAYGLQTQFINGITGVVAALGTGNPEAVVNAIITGAANFTQELLNGNPADGTHGLLGIYGAINGFLDARTLAEYFLRPPAAFAARTAAPDAVESAPDPLVADVSSISSTAVSAIGGAGTVTLSPATETPAAETPVTETPAAETPVEATPVEETPAAETPVEETPAAETPVVDAEPVVETEPTTLVRDSAQAKPGQLGLTKASEAGAGLAKSVRGEISKVASKIDEGIKKAFGQPTKTAATQSAGSDSSDTGSNE